MTTIAPLPLHLSRGNIDHELAALVLLLRHELVPSERLATHLEEAGSAIAVLSEAGRQSLFPRYTASDVAAAADTVREWRERRYDVRAVFESTYPRRLRDIYDKPALLFLQGTWDDQRDGMSVAIVGTREASEEGLHAARDAAQKAVRTGLTVLSGMAAGIDTAAHTAALDAGGRTVAVIGTGIEHVFPPENRALRDRIIDSGGAVVSQFFPSQPPAKWTFPLRNVVTSGLALATLIIEAGEISGTRKLARAALEHGRPVFLLKPLVEAHAWAEKMVTSDEYGIRAIAVDSADEVMERLTAIPALDAITT